MRYVIYARKSSESEERQILSIEAQLAELQEYSAKEKLEIVSVRGGAAHFCPATPEPRSARRGQNSVRATFKIHRQMKLPLAKATENALPALSEFVAERRALGKVLNCDDIIAFARNGFAQRLIILHKKLPR